MIITISGKACSGKTTLAKKIAESFNNVKIFSLDDVNDSLISSNESVKEFALKLFGENILDEDGLNKEEISRKIYNDENLYNAWCSFMKTKCEIAVLSEIAKKPDKIYIVEHIIVNETKFASIANFKILIIPDEQERIFNAINRDDLTIEQLQRRERFIKVYNLNDYDLIYDGKDPNFVIDTLKSIIKQ